VQDLCFTSQVTLFEHRKQDGLCAVHVGLPNGFGIGALGVQFADDLGIRPPQLCRDIARTQVHGRVVHRGVRRRTALVDPDEQEDLAVDFIRGSHRVGRQRADAVRELVYPVDLLASVDDALVRDGQSGRAVFCHPGR
jgi:hypothetical protein